jgi:glycosyltransferase involved in cell wall biosynthesis
LAPNVLAIFDMVYRHVAGVFSATEQERFERLFAARAREATLIYCGSDFVKQHDLVPCFPFAADRIRVFPLAPPTDLTPRSSKVDWRTLTQRYGVGNRFLFYPAALRAHKNHSMLVRALALLHRDYGDSSLHLVFTGEEKESPELRHLIHEETLSGYVHVLGIIPREDIHAFYRHALLVPLPSLHEGYGLPLLEALQSGCPVICADIPAFRELLTDQTSAVPFFNPHNPDAIARTIRDTLVQRDRIQTRQREVYQQITRRDWSAVARDFMQLFEEARRLVAEEKMRNSRHVAPNDSPKTAKAA